MTNFGEAVSWGDHFAFDAAANDPQFEIDSDYWALRRVIDVLERARARLGRLVSETLAS